MKRTAGFILALLLFGAGSAFAQLYKWGDINGRTRYGDIPPPGLDYERLKSPPPPPSAPTDASGKSADPSQRTPAELEMDFRRRQMEARTRAEKEEQAGADAEIKAGNCERAKEGLRNLESGKRVARFGADGERYFPEEPAIEQEKAGARKIIQENCN